MTHKHSEEELSLRRIPMEILSLAFLIALFAFFIFDWITGVFVLGGGVLSAASFIWHKNFVSKLILLKEKKTLFSALAFYGLRLVLILAIFFIIIGFFSKKIIAFAAGFSTIVPVFFIEAIFALSRMKKWKN
jgi:hypothetical protein